MEGQIMEKNVKIFIFPQIVGKIGPKGHCIQKLPIPNGFKYEI
jgi:hypothetical protein